MIGPENSHHSLNQSDEKLPPITIWWLAFSRALGSLAVFTSSSHVLLKVFYGSIEKRSISIFKLCCLLGASVVDLIGAR